MPLIFFVYSWQILQARTKDNKLRIKLKNWTKHDTELNRENNARNKFYTSKLTENRYLESLLIKRRQHRCFSNYLKLLLYSNIHVYSSYFLKIQVKRHQIAANLRRKSLFQITRPNKTGWCQQKFIWVFWGLQFSSRTHRNSHRRCSVEKLFLKIGLQVY